MDPDAKGGEEELGGLEGREQESRIYYVRNIYFNKRETLRRNKKSEQGKRSRPMAEEWQWICKDTRIVCTEFVVFPCGWEEAPVSNYSKVVLSNATEDTKQNTRRTCVSHLKVPTHFTDTPDFQILLP